MTLKELFDKYVTEKNPERVKEVRLIYIDEKTLEEKTLSKYTEDFFKDVKEGKDPVDYPSLDDSKIWIEDDSYEKDFGEGRPAMIKRSILYIKLPHPEITQEMYNEAVKELIRLKNEAEDKAHDLRYEKNCLVDYINKPWANGPACFDGKITKTYYCLLGINGKDTLMEYLIDPIHRTIIDEYPKLKDKPDEELEEYEIIWRDALTDEVDDFEALDEVIREDFDPDDDEEDAEIVADEYGLDPAEESIPELSEIIEDYYDEICRAFDNPTAYKDKALIKRLKTGVRTNCFQSFSYLETKGAMLHHMKNHTVLLLAEVHVDEEHKRTYKEIEMCYFVNKEIVFHNYIDEPLEEKEGDGDVK